RAGRKRGTAGGGRSRRRGNRVALIPHRGSRARHTRQRWCRSGATGVGRGGRQPGRGPACREGGGEEDCSVGEAAFPRHLHLLQVTSFGCVSSLTFARSLAGDG